MTEILDTPNETPPKTPKKTRHRLRKLMMLGAAAGGLFAYRNKKLGQSDTQSDTLSRR